MEGCPIASAAFLAPKPRPVVFRNLRIATHFWHSFYSLPIGGMFQTGCHGLDLAQTGINIDTYDEYTIQWSSTTMLYTSITNSNNSLVYWILSTYAGWELRDDGVFWFEANPPPRSLIWDHPLQMTPDFTGYLSFFSRSTFAACCILIHRKSTISVLCSTYPGSEDAKKVEFSSLTIHERKPNIGRGKCWWLLHYCVNHCNIN